MPRIHITGASGSGTTTLGAALGAALAIPHDDTDDYFWTKTDPPYSVSRPIADRLALMLPRFTTLPDWVLSGSTLLWGAPLDPLITHIVFLTLDPAIRMARLRARETTRHGARIAPGGDMYQGSQEFLSWAEAYDTSGPEQRSRVLHEQWLARQTVPILRLDSNAPVPALVAAVITGL